MADDYFDPMANSTDFKKNPDKYKRTKTTKNYELARPNEAKQGIKAAFYVDKVEVYYNPKWIEGVKKEYKKDEIERNEILYNRGLNNAYGIYALQKIVDIDLNPKNKNNKIDERQKNLVNKYFKLDKKPKVKLKKHKENNKSKDLRLTFLKLLTDMTNLVDTKNRGVVLFENYHQNLNESLSNSCSYEGRPVSLKEKGDYNELCRNLKLVVDKLYNEIKPDGKVKEEDKFEIVMKEIVKKAYRGFPTKNVKKNFLNLDLCTLNGDKKSFKDVYQDSLKLDNKVKKTSTRRRGL